jgi:hypothetical protein
VTESSRVLSAADLDYVRLRGQLLEWMRGQDRFSDYDFEGSNVAVLLDLLAHNDLLENFLLNMVASEMFIDTAELLDSQFSHAKELNYVPRSRTSARAQVSFVVDVGSDDPGAVTVPRFHRFYATGVDEQGLQSTYQFVTDEAVVVEKDSLGNYQASNVAVYEGRVAREVFVVNSTSHFVLQSGNVDARSVSVVVQTSNTDTSNSEFTRAESLFGLDESSEVFFVQGAYDGRYEVVFGDGNVGVAPSNGNLVRITYRDTVGDDGNGVQRFDSSDSADGYELVTSLAEPSYGGAERESVESIRFYAPRHFAVQERAVTKDDFIDIVRENFPQLEAVTAYGGEEVTPKQYGKVIISVKPYGDTVVSNQVKSDIVAVLTGKNAVTEPVIQDADFLYVDVESVVQYDQRVTSSSGLQVASLARDAVLEWIEDELNDFDADFRHSQLARAIDDSDPSVLSNDLTVLLYKKWSPQTGSVQSLVFSFDNPLKVAVRFSDPVNADPIVWTDVFSYEKNGVVYDAVMQDDGDGSLFVYAVQDDGSRVVVETEVGTVDYGTGSVQASLEVTDYDGQIRVYGLTESKNFSVQANKFLTVEPSSVRVTAVDDEG